MNCPDEETLRLFLRGKLWGEMFNLVADHLSTCGDCIARCQQGVFSEDALISELPRLRSVESFTIDDSCGQMISAIESQYANLLDSRRAEGMKAQTVPHLPSVSTPADSIQREVPLDADFGRYCIDAKIGSGGMATVYRAFDTKLKRDVALKIPHFFIQSDPAARKRFQQEAHAAAAISHQSVCTVLDLGEHDGVCFLTMPLLDGMTLDDRIYASPPLPLQEVLKAVCDLCDAVDAVHAKGVIHRDIKPANIYLTKEGKTILMDFGVAFAVQGNSRITSHGEMIGTPAYFSPEQASGEWDKVGTATDIYSIGVVLYEALSGKAPFEGPAGEVIGQILHSKPPKIRNRYPEADAQLTRICEKAMSKRPEDRYRNAAAISVAIRHWLDTRKATGKRFAIRAPVPLAIAATLLMVPVLVSGGFSWFANPQDGVKDRSTVSPSGASAASQLPEFLSLPANVQLTKLFNAEEIRTALDPAVRLGDTSVHSLSSDGSRLAILHNGPFAAIWDLRALKKVSDFPLPKNDTTLTLSQDGRLLLTAGGGWTLKVWELGSQKPKEVAAMPGHRNWINTLAMAEDSSVVASSSKDASIRFWNLEKNEEVWSHPRGVWMRSVAISPKKDFVLGGGNDGMVQVLSIQNGGLVHEVQASGVGIVEIQCSKNGEWFSTVDTDGLVKIWRWSDRSLVSQMQGAVGGGARLLTGRDGYFCTKPDGGIVFLSIPENRILWEMPRPKIGRVWHAVGVSNDDSRLVIRSNESHVAIFGGKWR